MQSLERAHVALLSCHFRSAKFRGAMLFITEMDTDVSVFLRLKNLLWLSHEFLSSCPDLQGKKSEDPFFKV